MLQLVLYALAVIQLRAAAAVVIPTTTCIKPMDAQHAHKLSLTAWTVVMLIPVHNVWMDFYYQQIVQLA